VTAPRGALAAPSELEQQIAAAKRMKAILRSRESLLDFLCFINPDPEFPDDCEKSAFQRTPVARLLCELLEKVERGEMLRVRA
jgi:hypothetical protein